MNIWFVSSKSSTCPKMPFASAAFETDEVMPAEWSRGFNRGELSVGGPLFGALSFFGAGTVEGRRSADNGKLWRDVPMFVANGVDTVVTVPASSGAVGQTDVREVVVPRFERYDEGGRSPFSNSDEYAVDGKLDEAPWQGQPTFELNYETFPSENAKPQVQTKVWMTYDAERLYVAFAALDFCQEALKSGGVFVLKAFQGEAFEEVLQRLKHDFGKVSVRKPEASRGESKETYVVARNPRKIALSQSPQKTGVSH